MTWANGIGPLCEETQQPHLFAALWEPMSLGRPWDSDVGTRSFTNRGNAMEARLHTYEASTLGESVLRFIIETLYDRAVGFLID